MNPTSRRESDLKLENLEQRIDHKLDRILISMEAGFRLIDKDMTWMKWMWMMGGILFLLRALWLVAVSNGLFIHKAVHKRP